MKIGIDGGALCAPQEKRFGNYVFSENIISELIRQYDNNEILVYSFCDWKDPISNPPASNGVSRGNWEKIILPKKGYFTIWLNLFNKLTKDDLFLALNQVIPKLIKAKVISFSHGLSFMFYPQFYPDSYHKMKNQIDDMAARSQYIIVSSERVKEEWLTLYPNLKNIVALPFGIPMDMQRQKFKLKAKIDNFLNTEYSILDTKYFLFVGMDHPIKNIEFIVDSFLKTFKEKKDIYLYLVGVDEIWENRGVQIKTFRFVSRQQLKLFYQNAQALLTASYYESFNLPVLEALSLDCPVIGLESAIIPELQKYVNISHNKTDFCEFISAVDSRQNVRTKLEKEFSWEKYVNTIQQLIEKSDQ